MKARMFTLAAAVFFSLFTTTTIRAQGTAFTYQGRLELNGAATSGNFDFRFGLYTNVTIGNQIGTLLTNASTAVSNGLFTTTLDFSNAFTGVPYWLEIGVRTNGSTGNFTTLSPRQAITPTPYAITAANATNLLGTLPATQLSGSLPASFLSGLYSNTVSFTNTGNSFSGNGTGLTGLITPTQNNYLFAYDNTTQYINTVNAFQYLTFSAAPNLNGWTITSGSILTAGQTGLYMVTYQVQIDNASASTAIAGVRGILNSATEIVGSESIVYIGAASVTTASKSFLLPISQGQTLQLQMAANLGSPYIAEFSGSFEGASFPGMTMTIVRLQ